MGRFLHYCLLIGLAAPALAGCQAIPWIAQGVAGDTPPPIHVTAEYRGMDNQRVAVLVDAAPETLYHYPLCQVEVASALSERIKAHVPGVSVADAKQVAEFQRRNAYWNTATYSELAEHLDVNRLVLVDLQEYRSHEPGDRTVWQGVISADVRVAETDGPNPDDAAYGTVVEAHYPPSESVGMLDADDKTIRLATLDLFAWSVVNRFHDHEEQSQ